MQVQDCAGTQAHVQVQDCAGTHVHMQVQDCAGTQVHVHVQVQDCAGTQVHVHVQVQTLLALPVSHRDFRLAALASLFLRVLLEVRCTVRPGQKSKNQTKKFRPVLLFSIINKKMPNYFFLLLCLPVFPFPINYNGNYNK